MKTSSWSTREGNQVMKGKYLGIPYGIRFQMPGESKKWCSKLLVYTEISTVVGQIRKVSTSFSHKVSPSRSGWAVAFWSSEQPWIKHSDWSDSKIMDLISPCNVRLIKRAKAKASSNALNFRIKRSILFFRWKKGNLSCPCSYRFLWKERSSVPIFLVITNLVFWLAKSYRWINGNNK